MRNISAKPNPSYRILLKKENFKTNFFQNFIFFNTGREAFLFGLKQLKIDKKKTILIPGYICRSLVEPIIKEGFKIEYYDINKNLSVDLKYLREIIKNKNISALVIVHYFGFLIDIKKIYNFCKSNDIELIEDFCHSFLTRVFLEKKEILNTTKIYSLRKNIPINDGGAIENMKFNRVNISSKNSFNYNDFTFLIFRSLESLINRIGIINLYCKLFQNFKKIIKKIKSLFTQEIVKDFKIRIKKPSYMLIRYLNSQAYLYKSIDKRRKNYNFLLKEINKFDPKIVFNKISNYSVPQFFPILINNKNKLLFNYLNKNGIETIKWPNYEIPKSVLNNKKKFKNSNFFNENIILIPVHQSLNKKDCKKMINIINLFLNEK